MYQSPILSEDLVTIIATYMAPDDLVRAMRVCRLWNANCQQDAIWKQLCIERWHMNDLSRLQKSAQVSNGMELYFYLHRNRMLPQGKFTSKRQIVWGKGRMDGLDAWLTVAHQPDCRLLRHRNQSPNFIPLRLIIQNATHHALRIHPADIRVQFKSGSIHTIEKQDKRLRPRLLAWNGSAHESTDHQMADSVHLRLFDWIVMQIHVECEEECEFEADFLASCQTLWLPFHTEKPQSYHQSVLPTCSSSLRLSIVDESIVWKFYKLVSGRFMVLDVHGDLVRASKLLAFKA